MRGLAKSRKSGFGGQAPQIDDLSKGLNKEVIALRPLAKSWKSGSVGQAYKIYGFNKDFNKEMMALRALGIRK